MSLIVSLGALLDSPRLTVTDEELRQSHLQLSALARACVLEFVAPGIADGCAIPVDGDVDVFDRDLQPIGVGEVFGRRSFLFGTERAVDLCEQLQVLLLVPATI